MMFFFVLPAGWKSIHRAALRAIGYQAELSILKMHIFLQAIALLLAFLFSFLLDLNFFAFVVSKALFEVAMSVYFWKM